MKARLTPFATALASTAILISASLFPPPALAGQHAHHQHGHHTHHPGHSSEPRLLVAGLGSGSGSTIGPDGALYVAQPAEGTITRISPRTGHTSTFAS